MTALNTSNPLSRHEELHSILIDRIYFSNKGRADSATVFLARQSRIREKFRSRRFLDRSRPLEGLGKSRHSRRSRVLIVFHTNITLHLSSLILVTGIYILINIINKNYFSLFVITTRSESYNFFYRRDPLQNNNWNCKKSLYFLCILSKLQTFNFHAKNFVKFLLKPPIPRKYICIRR